MSFLKIHCESCGGSWEVYSTNLNDNASKCPHCMAKIDKELWKYRVLHAFNAVNEANAELFRDSLDNHTPLFTIDVVANQFYTNRTNANNCPFSEILQDFENIKNTNFSN